MNLNNESFMMASEEGNADDAEQMKANNQNTILVRVETSPEDIHGMQLIVMVME